MQRGQIVWRVEDTLDGLSQRYHGEHDGTVKVRWHALWLLRRGFSRAEVCDVLGIDPRTLRDWIAWYRQGGCADVAQHHSGGPGAELRLTLDQLAALRTEINRGVFHTIGEVREWVETTWGVVYTYWGMRSVLDRLHVHSKVPRPQAVDADPVAQAAWKEDGATHALEAAQVTRAMHITWADEFRIGLFGGTRNVLAEVGVKVIQLVELQRDWYHLALTVDPKRGELLWSWITGTSGAAIAPAVAEWKEAGIDAIIWDGLTSHHGPDVREVGLVLIEQPAHSPELNPAERVGEWLRKKIEGKVFGTIWHKMAAVEQALRELAADPEKVKRLVGWDWIVKAIKKLPWKRKGS